MLQIILQIISSSLVHLPGQLKMNKYMEIIYTTKVKTNPSNWAPLSPYEQMFLDPDCTIAIEIVHANEEVYNKPKNFRKNKSTNKFRSSNAIVKNHKIEVKEILDKIKKNVEAELQILKVQMREN